MAGMRIGVAFTPFETRTDVMVRLAVRADELGLDRVEVAEGWAHDAIGLLAELGLRTERVGLGAGVDAVVAAAEDHRLELPAAAEGLAEEVTLLGGYQRAEEAIGEWLAAGADSVSLVLAPGRPEEELLEIVEVAAGAVAAASA